MKTRYCFPLVRQRGTGLGNDLIPWARSFQAAPMLGIQQCTPPAFGLDARQYCRHLGEPKYDWPSNEAIEQIHPCIEYSEDDYLRCGGGDFDDALRPFSEINQLQQRSVYVLATEAMWGGHRHINAARNSVYMTIYQNCFAARNLLTIGVRLYPDKITVGMHVRLSDFVSATPQMSDCRGKFDVSLALGRYINIAFSIQRQLGDNVHFLVISDGAVEKLQPLSSGLDAVTTSDIPFTDCSDLLALANGDLLVCAVSSYGTTAAYLTKSPYLWFKPNLQKYPEGVYSIGGYESVQTKNNRPTPQAIAVVLQRRAVDLGWGLAVNMSAQLLTGLLSSIALNKQINAIQNDLIQYGVVSVSRAAANP